MFEIGWTEILFIGLVAVLVLKPKDYPEMMRSIGSFIAKARQMAGEFQGQFNDALKDAKLDDVKKTIDEIRDLRNMGPVQQVRDTFTKIAEEATAIKTEVERTVTAPPATGSTTSGPTPPAVDTAAAMPVIEPPPFPTAPPMDLVPPAPAPAPAAVPAADAAPAPAPAPAPASETPGPTKAA